MRSVAEDEIAKRQNKLLEALFESEYGSSEQCIDYESHKARNPDRVEGTCTWFLKHPKYQNWRQECRSSLLWLSADAGCGKSVLASFLVGELRNSSVTCCSSTHYHLLQGNRLVLQRDPHSTSDDVPTVPIMLDKRI